VIRPFLEAGGGIGGAATDSQQPPATMGQQPALGVDDAPDQLTVAPMEAVTPGADEPAAVTPAAVSTT